MVKASIITIGDELLYGQVIDTNSAFIAKACNSLGIIIQERIAVGDIKACIVDALDRSLAISNIVFITGGLGPTADDITKPLLCDYFGGKMIRDESTVENLKQLFENYLKRPLTERNLSQANVPDVCKVIKNPIGTAPGMVFTRENKTVISMPGVPAEMIQMMELSVIPMLRQQYAFPPIVHKTISTFGIPESNLADLLVNFESELPQEIKLAYLPNFGINRLRLTTQANENIDLYKAKLISIVQDYLLTEEDESIFELISRKLKENGKMVGTAESCTGGNIAREITLLPGSSLCFKGSVVSYADEIKTGLLAIDKNLITSYGVVSKPVAEAMANSCRKLLDTDYAVATTGLMGPASPTYREEVGTVWIAASSESRTLSRQLKLRFNRSRNIEVTTLQAMILLWQLMND